MLNLPSIVSRLRQMRSPSGCGIIVNEHTLTAAQTRKHVDILGRWFDFIHHDDLLDRIEQPRRRPLPRAAMSFPLCPSTGQFAFASITDRLV